MVAVVRPFVLFLSVVYFSREILLGEPSPQKVGKRALITGGTRKSTATKTNRTLRMSPLWVGVLFVFLHTKLNKVT